MEFTRTFGHSLAAPSMARSSLDRLAQTISPDELDDVRLIVSELVTNSVKHAGLHSGDRIRMTVDVSPSRLRVEVTDPGGGFPAGPHQVYAQHGRGLAIVDHLAECWGSESGDETTVWAEMSLRDG
ncbi:MAG: ATP-binding protein [Actinomycetota bacterium]|nr:ATP-binding protein [Actinomycetota bacterium]